MMEIENKGVVSILRMARGKGNALNVDLLTALVNALDRLEQGEARAGVITGQGNVFGTGVDLLALVDGGPEYVRRFLPMLNRALERLATFPKPLVAAVNGHAIAGGAMVMLACDQRLLARGLAQIGLSEVRSRRDIPRPGAGACSLRHAAATFFNSHLHGTHLAA